MRAILLWAFFALLGAMPALAERHALVMGIDGYTRLEPLHKARNDARAVADSLQAAGFVVTRALDPDADALYDTLARFTAALRPGDEVVVYFAGHGVEVEGRNWLLPADMPLLRPGDEVKLRRAALATDDLMAEIAARGPQITLMILDACRDNPFPRQGTRSVGNTRGLARLEAPRGSYVIFSAGAGQTALDRLGEGDANPNSVFTRALLPRLAQPGLSIRDLAQQVRLEVDATARSIGHDQFPAIYDQLAGEFSILPAAVNTTSAVAQSPATPAPSKAPVSNPCTLFEARVAKAKTYGTETRIGAMKDLLRQAEQTVCFNLVQLALNEALADRPPTAVKSVSPTANPCTLFEARVAKAKTYGTETQIGAMKDLLRQAEGTVCAGLVEVSLNAALAEKALSPGTQPSETKTAPPLLSAGLGLTLVDDGRVRVAAVKQLSQASLEGVRVGDVVHYAGGYRVKSTAQLEKILADLNKNGDMAIIFQIYRGSEGYFVTLPFK